MKHLQSTIPLISTKRIPISCLNSLNTKIPYFVGNPGTIFGQAYKYGGVKSIINMSCALNLIVMFLLKKEKILPVITHL
jgi:hypothetical protein